MVVSISFLLYTGIEVLQLDVTKEEEWDLVIEHIQQNSKQLWGLVNNAGMYASPGGRGGP